MGIAAEAFSDFSVDISTISAMVARDKWFADLMDDYTDMTARIRGAKDDDLALRRRRAGLKETIEDILIAEAM